MFRKLISLLEKGGACPAFQPSLVPAIGISFGPHEESHAYSTIALPPASFIPPRLPGTRAQSQPSQVKDDGLEPGFIRREAVFSRHNRQVIGHELMLNHSSELQGSGTSPMLCRMHDELLIKSILALDVPQLIGDELVFIHISPSTLEHALILQLPSRNVVLAFRPDGGNVDRLVARCAELETHGFRFSLDDFTWSPGLHPLLERADFVRFDISHNSLINIGPQLEAIPGLSEKTLIAKNVHTPEALHIASLLDFRYYQGSRMEHSTPDLEPQISRYRARIIVLMNMLKNRSETSEIEDAVQQDGALAFRILRYINSPANGLQQEAHTISEALSKLGHDTLYRWLSLLLFYQDTSPRHHDRPLLEKALLRGRLTELFGLRSLPAAEKAGLFVSGMFSCLDLLFQVPLGKALSHFSLTTPLGDALQNRDGPYAPFLNLAIACVDHDQPGIEHHAKIAGIGIEQVNTIYVKALVWMHEIEK